LNYEGKTTKIMGNMMAMYPKLSLDPNFDQIMKKKPYDPISHAIHPKPGILLHDISKTERQS
jgi:hypothetical protein